MTPKMDWLVRGPGTNTFIADPDVFYPEYLGRLGVSPEGTTQFWLEIAFACMKRDFQRLAPFLVADSKRPFTLLVRGDDGRSKRWKVATLPKGKDPDWNALTLGERARHINQHYARIRG